MIILVKMGFDPDNLPNLGSIEFDREGQYLHLISTDISKLNSILTKTVCENTYHVDKFYFKSGDVAIVDDTQRAFVYNSTLDTWTEWDI